MTRRTARILHSLGYGIELLAATAAGLACWAAVSWVWAFARAWPWPFAAVVGAYAIAAGARLGFEAPRAAAALRRWHARAHRNIKDRTQPRRSTSKALATTRPEGQA